MKTKIKYDTFWVENNNFSQNFVFALEKLFFCCLDSDWGKKHGSGSEKNESGSETLLSSTHQIEGGRYSIDNVPEVNQGDLRFDSLLQVC